MGRLILICDDSRMARKQVQRALPYECAGEVLMVEGGREALMVLRSRPVDLLLLDLTMPDLDGFGVLQTLREEGRQLPVVVVSADIQPDAQARVRSLGAFAFLQKPVNAPDLRDVLEKCGLL